jgi:hypothetical protein
MSEKTYFPSSKVENISQLSSVHISHICVNRIRDSLLLKPQLKLIPFLTTVLLGVGDRAEELIAYEEDEEHRVSELLDLRVQGGFVVEVECDDLPLL